VSSLYLDEASSYFLKTRKIFATLRNFLATLVLGKVNNLADFARRFFPSLGTSAKSILDSG